MMKDLVIKSNKIENACKETVLIKKSPQKALPASELWND